MQDPDLLDELGEVSGDPQFASAGRRPSAGGERGGKGGGGGGGRGYDNDDEEEDGDGSTVEADRESDDDGAELEEVKLIVHSVKQSPPPLFFLLFTCFLLRGTVLSRTYGTHKHLYISLFFLSIFGHVYYCPP